MKQLKLMATASIAIITLMVVISCNSSSDKTSESTSDSPEVKYGDTLAVATPAEPEDVLVIRHRVKDFSKWLPAYEAHDSARTASGLKNFVIGRGDQDSNSVFVYLKMSDTAKAKAFGASADLKSAMQKGGVIGKPTVSMQKVVMMDMSPIEQTARVLTIAKVKDWDIWKPAFDAHKQARIDGGLIDRGVGYVMGDNKTIMLVFAVTDEAKAKAFFNSKDLKDRMAESGVVGAPTSYWYHVVKKY
jgi:hypothetical protein